MEDNDCDMGGLFVSDTNGLINYTHESYEIENIPGITYCKWVKLCDNMYLVGMMHPTILYFKGILEIVTVSGSVDIFGYYQKPTQKVTAYSMRGTSGIYISTTKEIIKNCFLFDYLTDTATNFDLTVIFEMYRKIQNNGAFIVISSNLKLGSLLERYNLNLLCNPKYIPVSPIWKNFESGLNCIIDTEKGNRIVKKFIRSPEMVMGTSHFMFLHGEKQLKLIMIGGQGYGKSTTLRYMINRFLNGFDKVALIDFDIGQPELNMPTCVSCHIVKNPLLGPSYTHLQEPKWCVCVGDINVNNCPNSYFLAVANLMRLCTNDPDLSGLPWFINTMGYTKGIGMPILSKLVAITNPTHAIILKSEIHRARDLIYDSKIVKNVLKASTSAQYKLRQNERFRIGLTIWKAPIDYISSFGPGSIDHVFPKIIRNAVQVCYFGDRHLLPYSSFVPSRNLRSTFNISDKMEIFAILRQIQNSHLECVGFAKRQYSGVDNQGEVTILILPKTFQLLTNNDNLNNAMTFLLINGIKQLKPIGGEPFRIPIRATWRELMPNIIESNEQESNEFESRRIAYQNYNTD